MESPGGETHQSQARFERVGVADARTVAHIRNEFWQWALAHLAVDENRMSDIVLAVNEALANSAEFAYRTFAEVGTVDIEATHNAVAAHLSVVVTDHGAWNDGDPPHRSDTRGRGIPLMHSLSDAAVIDRQPGGTQVRLEFGDCAAIADRPGAMSEA